MYKNHVSYIRSIEDCNKKDIEFMKSIVLHQRYNHNNNGYVTAAAMGMISRDACLKYVGSEVRPEVINQSLQDIMYRSDRLLGPNFFTPESLAEFMQCSVEDVLYVFSNEVSHNGIV